MHVGRLDAADFTKDWGIRPQPYDPAPGFAEAVRRDRLSAWIASLPPPYAGYDALVKGLARYRAMAAAGVGRRSRRPPSTSAQADRRCWRFASGWRWKTRRSAPRATGSTRICWRRYGGRSAVTA
ncbi:hypothetical protein GCM10020258_11840 [Sphingomonas yabuuchiae]